MGPPGQPLYMLPHSACLILQFYYVLLCFYLEDLRSSKLSDLSILMHAIVRTKLKPEATDLCQIVPTGPVEPLNQQTSLDNHFGFPVYNCLPCLTSKASSKKNLQY
jgi:hypothetical protein